MAKKTVASLQKEKGNIVKVITASKTDKGTYFFKEDFMVKDKAQEYVKGLKK